jgi:hypothetical protein
MMKASVYFWMVMKFFCSFVTGPWECWVCEPYPGVGFCMFCVYMLVMLSFIWQVIGPIIYTIVTGRRPLPTSFGDGDPDLTSYPHFKQNLVSVVKKLNRKL